MGSNIYTTIAICKSYARNGSQQRHEQALQLFPASASLDFTAIDILEPLQKTKQGSQYRCVRTDRYFNLARATSKSVASSTHMTNIIFSHWTVPFNILT